MTDNSMSPEVVSALQQASYGGNYTDFGYGAPTPPAPVPLPATARPGPDPNAAAFAAQNNVLDQKQRYLNASSVVNDAQGHYLAGTAGVLQAQQAALPAKQAQLQAKGAYLAEQTRANAARQAESVSMEAAKNNAGDIIGVARAQRDRNAVAYRYALAGVDTPIEIELPEGYNGPIPAGMVAKLQTLAERLAKVYQSNEEKRKFTLEAARLLHEEAGMDVDEKQLAIDAANIARGQAGLTLDQAQLALSRAGLDVDQAGLDLDRAKMPPAPGYVYDDQSQTWMPKSDFDTLDQTRKVQEGGPYGYFSVDALVAEAVRGTIDETTLRKVLTDPMPQGKGLLPGTADLIIQSVQLRKAEKEKSESGLDPSIIDAIRRAVGGGGSASTPGAPQPRGPQLGSPSGGQYFQP